MPIRIDISPLLKSVGNSLKIDEEETISYPDDNLTLTSPVKVTGKLVNVGETILFSGKVKTTVKLNCACCLEDFDYPLEFAIEEEYSKNPKKPAAKSGEIKLKDEDFVFAVEAGNIIDLSEVVRQNILTELPISPRCKKEGGS